MHLVYPKIQVLCKCRSKSRNSRTDSPFGILFLAVFKVKCFRCCIFVFIKIKLFLLLLIEIGLLGSTKNNNQQTLFKTTFDLRGILNGYFC